MKVLLDTHAFLWWVHDDPRLSPAARRIIADGENILFFSAASAWEIVLKWQLGKLKVRPGAAAFLTKQLSVNRIEALPVLLAHVLHLSKLPARHRDPFDRMLIAQSLVEDLPIVTADPEFQKYPVQTVW